MPKCGTVPVVYFTLPVKYEFLLLNYPRDIHRFFFLKYLGPDSQKLFKM